MLFLEVIKTITTEHEESLIESDSLIFSQENFTINSTEKQFQTTIEPESSTVVFDTTHTIVCNTNEIPLISNSVIIPSQSNITYDVGSTLFFTCQTGYESSFNQSSFTTCSMNGTWSLDTINITMCQLSKLE
jgi:hypothetical protein